MTNLLPLGPTRDGASSSVGATTAGLVQWLADLLFPPRCIACARRGRWICRDDEGRLPRLSGARCQRCATPLPGVATCARCWSDPPAFETITAAFAFEGAIRMALHQLKYRRARHLARPLVDAALEALIIMPSVDLIVPIPLHPRRLASRGYNQSELIAASLSDRMGLRLDRDSLSRIRDTAAQVDVAPTQRWSNIRGAFAVSGRALDGKRVLLVDDVATSASTLRSAAAEVAGSGASSVDAFVIARAGSARPPIQ